MCWRACGVIASAHSLHFQALLVDSVAKEKEKVRARGAGAAMLGGGPGDRKRSGGGGGGASAASVAPLPATPVTTAAGAYGKQWGTVVKN